MDEIRFLVFVIVFIHFGFFPFFLSFFFGGGGFKLNPSFDTLRLWMCSSSLGGATCRKETTPHSWQRQKYQTKELWKLLALTKSSSVNNNNNAKAYKSIIIAITIIIINILFAAGTTAIVVQLSRSCLNRPYTAPFALVPRRGCMRNPFIPGSILCTNTDGTSSCNKHGRFIH